MKRLLLTIFMLLCAAQQAVAAAPIDTVQRYMEHEALDGARAAAGQGARVEVAVTPIEPRFTRGQCTRVEPFLPPGARLWGQTHVGVRCVEGGNWSLQWPVTVRVFGPALVASRPIAPMEPIAATDLRTAEVEWTRAPQGFVTTIEQVDQRMSQRAIGPGQPIGLDQLRVEMAIGQGDTVKLVASGDGFSIVSDGQAMNAAAAGQTVRVRTDSGRVLSGTARGNRVVEVVF
jgi:flagellar basal body P-ring formation protein FlgA